MYVPPSPLLITFTLPPSLFPYTRCVHFVSTFVLHVATLQKWEKSKQSNRAEGDAE